MESASLFKQNFKNISSKNSSVSKQANIWINNFHNSPEAMEAASILLKDEEE